MMTYLVPKKLNMFFLEMHGSWGGTSTFFFSGRGIKQKSEAQRFFSEDQNKNLSINKKLLGGGFKHFLFSSLFGEDSHFD